MNYVVPALFLIVVLFALIKKVNVFDASIEGIRDGFQLVVKLLPYLAAIFIVIELFRSSGLSQKLAEWSKPLFLLFGIPNELCELIILRPLSGSGSLVVLEKIYESYGADSYIGRVASVLMSSSDTILYIAAVYFSVCKNKKSGKAIPIALIAMFVGTILTCLLCRVM